MLPTLTGLMFSVSSPMLAIANLLASTAIGALDQQLLQSGQDWPDLADRLAAAEHRSYGQLVERTDVDAVSTKRAGFGCDELAQQGGHHRRDCPLCPVVDLDGGGSPIGQGERADAVG